MKKSLIGFFCSAALLSIPFIPQSNADEWPTKACRLTVVSDEEATMECVGNGMVCATVFDCFGIFKPGMG